MALTDFLSKDDQTRITDAITMAESALRAKYACISRPSAVAM